MTFNKSHTPNLLVDQHIQTEVNIQKPTVVDRGLWQADVSLRRAIGSIAIPGINDYSADPTKGDISISDYSSVLQTFPSLNEYTKNGNMYNRNNELQEAWPEFIETFKMGTRNGIDKGYIPEEVETRTIVAINNTGVRSVSTGLRSVLGASTAYYESNHDDVGVYEDTTEQGESYVENLIHEFTHKVSGGTFLFNPSSSQYERLRIGFATELKPNNYVKTGLNEAVTQHLTMGIITNDFETVDPDKRPDSDQTYYVYRKALAIFIERARGIIDLKSITNAYYEETNSKGGVGNRRKMVREVTLAYGYGALKKFDELCEFTEGFSTEDAKNIIDSRIHPPTFDSNGNVITLGNIDTTQLSIYDFFKAE